MQSKGLSEKIIPYTSHLHSIGGEKTASVHESWSIECHWVVSLGHDEHTDEPLVTVDYEITTELSHVFSLPD